MAEVSYLGYSRVNNDTDIDGDLVGVSQKWIVATPKRVRVSRKKLSI